MCSWATAPFPSCLMALMDTVWTRSLKLNYLLLLASLSVIQRLINGIQQNLQSKQQQGKRQNELSFWRRLVMMVIFFFFNLTLWFNKCVFGCSVCQKKKKKGSAKGAITEEETSRNASHKEVFVLINWLASQDLHRPFIVYPAESGVSGTVLACVRFPNSSWAQSGSQHSVEAAPQSQLAEVHVALEGENRCRLACAALPPSHRAALSTFQLLVVT